MEHNAEENCGFKNKEENDSQWFHFLNWIWKTLSDWTRHKESITDSENTMSSSEQ